MALHALSLKNSRSKAKNTLFTYATCSGGFGAGGVWEWDPRLNTSVLPHLRHYTSAPACMPSGEKSLCTEGTKGYIPFVPLCRNREVLENVRRLYGARCARVYVYVRIRHIGAMSILQSFVCRCVMNVHGAVPNICSTSLYVIMWMYALISLRTVLWFLT